MQVFPKQNPYTEAWLAANHGKYDNIWTAEYETRLQQAAEPVLSDLLNVLTPNYGPDVRMSNGMLLGSNQNEFQIDVNPTNSLNAIGTSNDGQTAGVGIFRTTDGGMTWTSRDASFYGVPAACCDPGNAFGTDGKAYAIILDTSPAATYILRSTDGGGTWAGPSQVSTPDRPNVAVDPTNSNIVYITFTDFNQPAGRIAGYKSTDGGVTWGSEFLIGDPISPPGYQQSSQPRVASNGWIYVGYQEYNYHNAGCAAGVRNEVARSTDGGATWTITAELNIVQGGACSTARPGAASSASTAPATPSARAATRSWASTRPTRPTSTWSTPAAIWNPPALIAAAAAPATTATRYSANRPTAAPPGRRRSRSTATRQGNKDQYYPWMSVLPNGQIWVGWNDRRDDANDFLSKWYQAHSDDEGTTWLDINGAPGNDVVADVQTQPSTFIGDYHGLGASGNGNGNVLGMWFDSRNSSSGDAYTDPQVPPPLGPTPTASPTPTSTPTASPTPTATATSTPCVGNYTITQIGGSIVPGTTDIGNHGDDTVTTVALPFSYNLYDQTFTSLIYRPMVMPSS